MWRRRSRSTEQDRGYAVWPWRRARQHALYHRLQKIAQQTTVGRHYLAGHMLRARRYALMLAEELNLPDEIIQAMSLAGYVYDIGAISIPDSVLLKSTGLSNSERRAIQEHVFSGYLSVRNADWVADQSPRLMDHVYDAILFHHERWDGNGYPYARAGEDIPLVARVMAVADSFAAITAERPHRPALPVDLAVAEIEAGAGTQFAPKVAEVFCSMLRRGYDSSWIPPFYEAALDNISDD